MKVTFIGLGIMGSRMAANLLKNGVELTVYNRSKEVVEYLVRQGAKAANSANEAVAEADIVFSMLSTPEVVDTLFMGPDGVLSNMKKGAIWADCTTVNPSFSLKAAAKAVNAGIQFLDAPVAGTKPHAGDAELVFFVGAEKPLLAVVQPYLEMMGKKIIQLGKLAKGLLSKC